MITSALQLMSALLISCSVNTCHHVSTLADVSTHADVTGLALPSHALAPLNPTPLRPNLPSSLPPWPIVLPPLPPPLSDAVCCRLRRLHPHQCPHCPRPILRPNSHSLRPTCHFSSRFSCQASASYSPHVFFPLSRSPACTCILSPPLSFCSFSFPRSSLLFSPSYSVFDTAPKVPLGFSPASA